MEYGEKGLLRFQRLPQWPDFPHSNRISFVIALSLSPSSASVFHRRMRTEPCGADTARGGHNMTHCHCSARSVLLEQLRNPSILEISQVIFSSSRCNAPISSSARRCKDPRGSHLRGFFTDLALLHANAWPEEIPWKRIKVRSHDADACLLLSGVPGFFTHHQSGY